MPLHSKNLSKKEIDKMFYKLCCAISEMKTAKESAEFLRDLISYPEAEMIAKRFKIAEMLDGGHKYDHIKEKLKVSFGTISRVQEWLNISGEGYRNALRKTKNDKIDRENELNSKEYALVSVKKRFPLYHWPEIVLENIVVNMNTRQKQKMKGVFKEMGKMKEKSELYNRLKRYGF